MGRTRRRGSRPWSRPCGDGRRRWTRRPGRSRRRPRSWAAGSTSGCWPRWSDWRGGGGRRPPSISRCLPSSATFSTFTAGVSPWSSPWTRLGAPPSPGSGDSQTATSVGGAAPALRRRVRIALRFPFRTHIRGLVPASDVNWLAHVQPRAPRTLGPRCRSGSGHSSLATWGGWPGLVSVLEGCRTICVGVVRSDLIVCGPSVAPMWPQPVWSEVQGAAVTQVLGGDRTPAGSRCSELRPAAAGPIPGPSMPPATRWGDATAGHLPGEPPTCGGNPRTSVWRAADPCRAGASCRPQARPPPATGPWIDHHQHHQGGAYRTAFTLTAAPTSEGWL
jgi:hypothetical protein